GVDDEAVLHLVEIQTLRLLREQTIDHVASPFPRMDPGVLFSHIRSHTELTQGTSSRDGGRRRRLRSDPDPPPSPADPCHPRIPGRTGTPDGSRESPTSSSGSGRRPSHSISSTTSRWSRAGGWCGPSGSTSTTCT